MTTAAYLHRHAIPTALALLPPAMDTPNAWAMLLAIAYQESDCDARVQRKGPARSFWMFEPNGIKGVMTHAKSRDHAVDVLNVLAYTPWTVADVHVAVTHNDVLAAAFARLLLWTDKAALPEQSNGLGAWRIYERVWRPGKPHIDRWPAAWSKAWEHVDGR